MAKSEKKSPKQASTTFHNIMAASVKAKPILIPKNKSSNMYYSRQFTAFSTNVPTEMKSILDEINQKNGTIVSVTQSSVDVDGTLKVSVIIIYSV